MVPQWWKVDLRSPADIEKLQDQFFAIFTAQGAPRGAAMFIDDERPGSSTVYFSPKAVEIAEALFAASRGEAIPQPQSGGFLAGHHQDKDMLPRRKR